MREREREFPTYGFSADTSRTYIVDVRFIPALCDTDESGAGCGAGKWCMEVTNLLVELITRC